MIVYLASRSPRRRQLLEWAGIAVEAVPTHVDETRDPWDPPVKHARKLALRKAEAGPLGRLIVAADTVVHIGDAIFEIPVSRSEAESHLRALSGDWHRVTTGVCVRRNDVREAFTVTTEVRFRDLSDADILAYLLTGEADDKAGAYGIQGRGGSLVAEIRGSWTNVMGLPLEETVAAIAKIAGGP